MAADRRGTKEERDRKRTAHKKSKRGCGNCKLRRVKCDETRPKCIKCTNFGVSCNYDPETLDLQMSFDGTAILKSSHKSSCPTEQNIPRINKAPACLYPTITDGKSIFQLDGQSLDRAGKFKIRTVLMIGPTKVARHFQGVMTNLAFSYPYVMHMVQTITAAHDRHMSSSFDPRHTAMELYNLSQAVALFNRKLSEPVRPSEHDALWTTAALLGAFTLSSIEASSPEEAWPLKSPDPSDLGWLRISQMKKVIWNLTNPLRPESAFYALAEDYSRLYLSTKATHTMSGVEHIPSVFVELFGLNSQSTADNSPYYAAIQAFSPLLCIECDQHNLSTFLSFLGHVKPELRRLLEIKDSRALLLLAYWYSKMCNSVWWIKRRATLECQAICLYLERFHASEREILELLPFPKMRCGLVI